MRSGRWARSIVAVLLSTSALGCAQRAAENPLVPTAACGFEDPADLVACLAPSIAFVTTPIASGSGFVVDGGYVVTNAHVVDPFAEASVQFEDRQRPRTLPVVGVDIEADIAVLGPLREERQALTLTGGRDLPRGSAVYLLGFPGEVESEPELTVSSGVLSRVRSAEHFDQHYLQTDASIAGGQSGGALVDNSGSLIGISGLTFTSQFALALDGADALAAVQRILAGERSRYASIPPGPLSRSIAVSLDDSMAWETLLIPYLDEEQVLTIEADPPDVAIEVTTLLGETLLLNDVAADHYAALDDPGSAFKSELAQPASGLGRWTVDAPAGIELLVSVFLPDDDSVDVTITASEYMVLLPSVQRSHLDLSDDRVVVRGIIDHLEAHDVFSLDLEAGEQVTVTARSPQGDVAILLRQPDETLAEATLFDDGGGGLFDLDAVGTFRATTAGTHHLLVFGYDGVATGYELEVDRRPSSART